MILNFLYTDECCFQMVNLEKVKEIAINYNLDLIYLFGSKAVHRDSKLSDLDIAVHLKEKGNYNLKELLLNLIFEFTQVFKFDNIDLMILNTAPLAIQYNVIAEGAVLYYSSIEEKCTYETIVIKKYLDFKRYEKEYFGAMHDQILKEY